MCWFSSSAAKAEKERSYMRFSFLYPAVLSSSFASAATLSHLHTPNPLTYLCILLSALNYQSQSDLWNIWEVTKYDGEGDNISRPMRRTGTLSITGPRRGRRADWWSKARGPSVLWVGVIGTMWAPPHTHPLQGLEKKQNSLSHNITFN